jgi:hypothetical protein
MKSTKEDGWKVALAEWRSPLDSEASKIHQIASL